MSWRHVFNIRSMNAYNFFVSQGNGWNFNGKVANHRNGNKIKARWHSRNNYSSRLAIISRNHFKINLNVIWTMTGHHKLFDIYQEEFWMKIPRSALVEPWKSSTRRADDQQIALIIIMRFSRVTFSHSNGTALKQMNSLLCGFNYIFTIPRHH